MLKAISITPRGAGKFIASRTMWGRYLTNRRRLTDFFCRIKKEAIPEGTASFFQDESSRIYGLSAMISCMTLARRFIMTFIFSCDRADVFRVSSGCLLMKALPDGVW